MWNDRKWHKNIVVLILKLWSSEYQIKVKVIDLQSFDLKVNIEKAPSSPLHVLRIWVFFSICDLQNFTQPKHCLSDQNFNQIRCIASPLMHYEMGIWPQGVKRSELLLSSETD